MTKAIISVIFPVLSILVVRISANETQELDSLNHELTKLRTELQELGNLRTEVEELRTLKHEVKYLRRQLNYGGLEKARRSLLLPPVWNKCPNGTVQHDDSCYMVSHEVVNWPIALVYCEAYGGNLAMIESDREQTFLTSFIQGINGTDANHIYWLGGLDALSNNEWFWSKSAEPLKYTHWLTGEPNNAGGDQKSKGEDCLLMTPGGYWNDVPCEHEHNFICEIKLNEHSVLVG